MGEKIKTLSAGQFLDKEIEIELNHPTVAGSDDQVHIQSDKFRFEMDKKDFIGYALSILAAEKNLKKIKGLE